MVEGRGRDCAAQASRSKVRKKKKYTRLFPKSKKIVGSKLTFFLCHAWVVVGEGRESYSQARFCPIKKNLYNSRFIYCIIPLSFPRHYFDAGLSSCCCSRRLHVSDVFKREAENLRAVLASERDAVAVIGPR